MTTSINKNSRITVPTLVSNPAPLTTLSPCDLSPAPALPAVSSTALLPSAPVSNLAVNSAIASSIRFRNLGINRGLQVNNTLAKERIISALNQKPALPEEDPPKVSIEGLRISLGLSPVRQDVGTESQSVSIVQESNDSGLRRIIVENMMGPQPHILSSVKVPSLTSIDIDSFLEVTHFEKEIIKESLEIGVNRVRAGSLSLQGKAAEDEMRRGLKLAEDRISALSYMRDTLESAGSGLNVFKISQQIMQKASDTLSQILTPSEAASPALPRTIDDYISLSFSFPGFSDRYLTNTSRLTIVAQDMFQACLSSHPSLLSNLSRGDIRQLKTLFSIPGAFLYDPDGDSSTDNSLVPPTVLSLFSRNDARSTIKGQFTPDRTSGTRINPGFITSKGSPISAAGSNDEMWDDVLHSICALSNEMILSAGIGRLQGSKLGNRFLERSTSSALQFDPFIRVLGFSPTAGADTVAKFFTTGPDRAGSLVDFFALGEEVDGEEFVVMPFETNTVEYENNNLYVSGKQYFLDLPLQVGGDTLPGALQRFAKQYSDITRDVSNYMTELMSLDTPTPLSPELLMSRILQDLVGAVSSFADESVTTEDKRSGFVAALFAQCGFHDDKSTVKVKSGPDVLLSDVLKMSVIKALSDLDFLLEDKTYFLSRETTSYSAGSDQSPEENLILSINDLDRAGDDSSVIDPVNTITLASGVTGEYEFLHNRTFQSKNNLINLVARTIREIQREALNLAQRGGATSDYRNASGGTLMSNCDEDRLVDVVVTIYTNLAYLLFPVSLFTGRTVRYDRNRAQLCSALLGEVLGSLVNGSSLSVTDIEQKLGLDEEVQINLSPGGDNTAISTPASIVDALRRLPWHRYYIKSSLKILEATASGVAATSSKAGRLFDIIAGSVNRKDLKGNELVLYDMFVSDSDRFEDLKKNITDHQLNLMVQAKSLYGMPSSNQMRKDVSPSRSEKLAVRDFIKSAYERTNLDDLHVVSVGIPSGLLESLYNPSFEVREGKQEEIASRGTESDTRSRYVRVELDRFDNVYYNAVSSVVTNVMKPPSTVIPTPPSSEYDPEIFILPDSIQYDPATRPGESLTVLDAILRSTVFYRIRRGRIIDQISGNDISDFEVSRYANTLRSYLLDLFLYDVAGVRHYDGTSPAGPPRVSTFGLEFVKAASGNTAASRVLVSKPGFYRSFDPNSGRIRAGEDLRSLLSSRTGFSPPEFTRRDIKFSAALACVSPLCDVSGIVSFRPYERIYHFFYDEGIVRNQLPGDPGIDTKSKRRNFDIYTLAARVTYGGGGNVV